MSHTTRFREDNSLHSEAQKGVYHQLNQFIKPFALQSFFQNIMPSVFKRALCLCNIAQLLKSLTAYFQPFCFIYSSSSQQKLQRQAICVPLALLASIIFNLFCTYLQSEHKLFGIIKYCCFLCNLLLNQAECFLSSFLAKALKKRS